MGNIKDRKMTPLLLKQIAFQEERIKTMMRNEAAYFYFPFCTTNGTFYSIRFKNYGHIKRNSPYK